MLRDLAVGISFDVDNGGLRKADSMTDSLVDSIGFLDEDLKDVSKSADKLGDEFSDSFSGAESSMDDLMDDMKKTDKKMDDLGDSMDDAGKKGKIGFGAIAGAAAASIGAIASAGAAIGGLVAHATNAASEINQYAQVTGMSTEAFQEWDHVMKTFGHSGEAAAGDMAMLAERAVEAASGTGEGAEMFDQLGVSVLDASGELKSQGQLFDEVIAGLQGMENQTERNALATALLSTTGEELAPVLNMTAEELENMKNSANVIDDDQLNQAEKFRQEWNNLTSTFSGVATELGIKFIPALQGVMDLVQDNMPAIQNTLDDFFTFIGDVFSWFGDVVEGGMTEASGVIEGVWNEVVQFWKENGQEIYNNASIIFNNIVSVLKTAFDEVWATIQFVVSLIAPFISQQLAHIQSFWQTHGDTIMQAIQTAFSFIQGTIQFVMPLVRDIIGGAWTAISSIFSGAIDIIMGLIATFSGLLTGDFTAIKDGLLLIWNGLWNAIGGVVSGAWEMLSEPFATLWENLTGWFTGVKEDAVGWGTDIILGLWEGIKSMGAWLGEQISGFIDKYIPDVVTDTLGIHSPSRVAIEQGSFYGEGLGIGILDKANEVENASNKLANATVDGYNPQSQSITPNTYHDQQSSNVFSPYIRIEVNGGSENAGTNIREELERLFPSLMNDFIRVASTKN
ncbi:phage tail tape measure protein [Gracilibacillus oryzae]|uniref:Phage tail tape measure protein n=1 Tax=Gracilibacillus oryzae TaxID=1672701 RepID=A0A7C8L6C1_9BACI|nr:phage tail tape measure protein [Gracilibacillus oryzae]KAB8139263.1 phage tail tape measure protein [Gracilibacillus oryzae]